MYRTTATLRRSCFVLLWSFVVSDNAAQATGHDSEQSLPGYVVLVSDSVAVNDYLDDDTLFYSISRGVTFPVNKSRLNLNDPFIVELSTKVLPQVRQRGLKLVGIGLRGAASPEGPYNNNINLSRRRAQAITQFLTTQLEEPAGSNLYTSTVAEDYAYLVLLMQQCGDPETQLVSDIVARHKGDMPRTKRALQAAQGGKLWKRLLAQYYPQLRTARIVLFFKPQEETVIIPAAPDSLLPPLLPQAVTTSTPQLAVEVNPESLPITVVHEEPRRHMLSVSTNLLYDLFYLPRYGWAPMPNLELEYYPRRGRWTVLAALTFPYWQHYKTHKFFQIRDYHFEVRRYFKPGWWHTGWFAAAYVNNNIYGIGYSKTDGWEGEGLGAALKAGHVWRLGHRGRWRLELSAAAGGYVTRFDPYVYGNPITGTEDGDYYYDYTGPASDFTRRNHQRVWLGPTEVSLKLRCDLLFRRKEVAP